MDVDRSPTEIAMVTKKDDGGVTTCEPIRTGVTEDPDQPLSPTTAVPAEPMHDDSSGDEDDGAHGGSEAETIILPGVEDGLATTKRPVRRHTHQDVPEGIETNDPGGPRRRPEAPMTETLGPARHGAPVKAERAPTPTPMPPRTWLPLAVAEPSSPDSRIVDEGISSTGPTKAVPDDVDPRLRARSRSRSKPVEARRGASRPAQRGHGDPPSSSQLPLKRAASTRSGLSGMEDAASKRRRLPSLVVDVEGNNRTHVDAHRPASPASGVSPYSSHAPARRPKDNTHNDDDDDDDVIKQSEHIKVPDFDPPNKPTSPDSSAASPMKMGLQPKKTRDQIGRTLLARACAAGELESVRARYLERPQDLNLADHAGNTPLQIASLEGREDIVEQLIEYRADVNCQNHEKETPLIDAVENRHLGVVRRLLDAGADPTHRKLGGDKPVELLDPDHRADAEFRAVLNAAVQRWLRRPSDDANAPAPSHHGDPSSRGVSASSPPRSSPPPRRRTGRSEATRKDLLWVKPTPENLRLCAGKGDMAGVATILNVLGRADGECLIAAARGGHDEVIQLLLGIGEADPDPTPLRSHRDGYNTPMLAAIGGGNEKVIRLLLDQSNFDPTRRAHRGKTYHDIAMDRQGPNWEREYDILKEAHDSALERERSRAGQPRPRPSTNARHPHEHETRPAAARELDRDDRASSRTRLAPSSTRTDSIPREGTEVAVARTRTGADESHPGGVARAKRSTNEPPSSVRTPSKGIPVRRTSTGDQPAGNLPAGQRAREGLVGGRTEQETSRLTSREPTNRRRSGQTPPAQPYSRSAERVGVAGRADSSARPGPASTEMTTTAAEDDEDDGDDDDDEAATASKRAVRTKKSHRLSASPKRSPPHDVRSPRRDVERIKQKRRRVGSQEAVSSGNRNPSRDGRSHDVESPTTEPMNALERSTVTAVPSSSHAETRSQLPKGRFRTDERRGSVSHPTTERDSARREKTLAGATARERTTNGDEAGRPRWSSGDKKGRDEASPRRSVTGPSHPRTADGGRPRPRDQARHDQAGRQVPETEQKSEEKKAEEERARAHEQRERQRKRAERDESERKAREANERRASEEKRLAEVRRQEEERAREEEEAERARQVHVRAEEERRREEEARAEKTRQEVEQRRRQMEQDELRRQEARKQQVERQAREQAALLRRQQEEERALAERVRQQQEAERQRREALPAMFKRLGELSIAEAQSPTEINKFLPVYTVTLRELDPACAPDVADERCMSNLQATPLLGLSDPALPQCTSLSPPPPPPLSLSLPLTLPLSLSLSPSPSLSLSRVCVQRSSPAWMCKSFQSHGLSMSMSLTGAR